MDLMPDPRRRSCDSLRRTSGRPDGYQGAPLRASATIGHFRAFSDTANVAGAAALAVLAAVVAVAVLAVETISRTGKSWETMGTILHWL